MFVNSHETTTTEHHIKLILRPRTALWNLPNLAELIYSTIQSPLHNLKWIGWELQAWQWLAEVITFNTDRQVTLNKALPQLGCPWQFQVNKTIIHFRYRRKYTGMNLGATGEHTFLFYAELEKNCLNAQINQKSVLRTSQEKNCTLKVFEGEAQLSFVRLKFLFAA